MQQTTLQTEKMIEQEQLKVSTEEMQFSSMMGLVLLIGLDSHRAKFTSEIKGKNSAGLNRAVKEYYVEMEKAVNQYKELKLADEKEKN